MRVKFSHAFLTKARPTDRRPSSCASLTDVSIPRAHPKRRVVSKRQNAQFRLEQVAEREDLRLGMGLTWLEVCIDAPQAATTPMFSLQKLLGKSDVFFPLLQQSAQEVQRSITALRGMFLEPGEEKSIAEFTASRRRDKEITEKINEALCKTFVTELEREDIEALSVALYKIPKTVEKIAERFSIYRRKIAGCDFSKQLAMMESSAGIVVQMVNELCTKMHLERMKGQNAEMQAVEGAADKLMSDLLRDLYNDESDPIRLIMLRDIYDLMEKVIDRCRDAGNVLSTIVLKYS